MQNIRLDDFTMFKFISGPKFSPGGGHICFTVHRMDMEENKYLSNLWVYNMKDKEYSMLTTFDEENGFTWLDEDTVLFPGSRDPKQKEKKEAGEEFTQFYKISVNGGEAQKFFCIPAEVTEIRPVDEDTYLITAKYDLYRIDTEGMDDKEKKQITKDEKDYQVLDEIPFWVNGKGFANKIRNRLYIYHKKENNLEPLTDEYTGVISFNLNSDRSEAVFVAYSFKDKMGVETDIFKCSLKDKSVKKLSPDDGFAYDYADFIDGSNIICVGSDMKNYGVNENRKFYIIDREGSRRCITPGLDVSIGNFIGSDSRYGIHEYSMAVDKGYLYFISTQGYNSYLNRIDAAGNIERVITNNGSVDDFDVKDGEVVFAGFRDLKLQELYELKDGIENPITHFNDWMQTERKLSRPEKLTVETAPGVSIDGWVIYPIDFDENKKYPAILDIHGGPKAAYGEIYFHEMQYWAAEGYFIFFCNPRGSDGKGNEFADIRGKYGTIDYEDIMKFTDCVLDHCPYIDSSGVGVTGGSYGGYMTNWIIGHTDRFKAAASQRSISNWLSDFGTADIGYYFNPDQLGGTPWNNTDKYWEHSPLKYADKAKTPTLFIHSDEDYRCWMGEGLQMFTALKYFGVESRLVLFHGENHELSRSGKPKHRIRRLMEITEWFDRHLK